MKYLHPCLVLMLGMLGDILLFFIRLHTWVFNYTELLKFVFTFKFTHDYSVLLIN